MANSFQTLTVEYTVTGALDGVTPAPELAAPRNTGDINQMYRPANDVELLGLIDPDFTSTGDATGIAPRIVSPLYINGDGVFAPGAQVAVVDAPSGNVITTQELIASPSGSPPFYTKDPIYVPQASALLVSGLAAGGSPIIVRASFFVLESPKDLIDALAAICCFEGSGVVPLGNMAFTGNLGGVETVIAVVGTFVRVGNGNPGTHPVFVSNPNNLLFTLEGATAPTQRMLYNGTTSARMCIRGAMSVQDPTASAEGFAIQLLQNGVVIANTTMEGQTGGLVTSAGSIYTEGVVMASPGDEFTFEIANLTSTQNLVVSSALFTVGAADGVAT